LKTCNEAAVRRFASRKAVANERLKADLYGLKDEKAHVRGKLLPFVFAHQTLCIFFADKIAITSLV